MKRLFTILISLFFLLTMQVNAQSGRNCSNAITTNLNSNWTRLGTDQFNGQNPKFWKFTAPDCGYLYICGTGDIAKDCNNGSFEPVSANFTCNTIDLKRAYKVEPGKRYYISVNAGFAGNFADVAFITDQNACDDQGCQHLPSNCSQVSCTPQTPTGNGSSYSCKVSANFNGSNRVAYWEVDGQKVNTSSNSRTFTVRRSGTILICCYYYCNGQIYKCCREVYCPPTQNCSCSRNYNPVCGADGKEYSNSCLAECAGVSWTPGVCQGQGQGCGGYCEEDDFSQYNAGKKIAQKSSKWRTWDRGREGSSQDAWVTTASTGRHILKLEPRNDVVYNLGNKRSGTHCLTTRFWVKDKHTAYYNIQSDYSRNVGGGYWNITFKNGTARLAHTNYSFRYTSNNWMKIYMKFHLDSRTVEFICEQKGRVIGRKSLRYNSRINLGGINLHGIDYAEYYCDYIQLNCGNNGYFADSDSRANSEKIDVVTEEIMSRKKVKKKPFDPSVKDSPIPNPSKQKIEGPIE